MTTATTGDFRARLLARYMSTHSSVSGARDGLARRRPYLARLVQQHFPAERGAAILMSTHLLGVAERLCDRIVVMNHGKLVADKRGHDVVELLARGPTAIEDLYVSLIEDESSE
jgi:ABC-type Na+ transport system ATPase subunit NatA